MKKKFLNLGVLSSLIMSVVFMMSSCSISINNNHNYDEDDDEPENNQVFVPVIKEHITWEEICKINESAKRFICPGPETGYYQTIKPTKQGEISIFFWAPDINGSLNDYSPNNPINLYADQYKTVLEEANYNVCYYFDFFKWNGNNGVSVISGDIDNKWGYYFTVVDKSKYDYSKIKYSNIEPEKLINKGEFDVVNGITIGSKVSWEQIKTKTQYAQYYPCIFEGVGEFKLLDDKFEWRFEDNPKYKESFIQIVEESGFRCYYNETHELGYVKEVDGLFYEIGLWSYSDYQYTIDFLITKDGSRYE